MDLDFDNYFNATITVWWALFFVPYALRERRMKLFGLVAAAMLVCQITLSMHFAHREFPFNFLAGVSSFCFALLVGYLFYLYESKQKKDSL